MPLPTRARIVVVRHAAELSKPTGTARWAALALPGCTILDYALPPDPFDEATLPTEGAALVFPGREPSTPPAVPPDVLIVPDGTWQQARRMVARLGTLRGLPRLSLPAPPGPARLRRSPVEGGMSTLEAIAAALELCGEAAAAEGLRRLHDLVLERTRALRGWTPGVDPP